MNHRRLSFSWIAVFSASVLLRSSAPALADSVTFGPPYISTGTFLRPFGIAVDRANSLLLVADTGNERWKWIPIKSIPAGGTYTDVGYVSNRHGAGALTDPNACAVDSIGNVFVLNPLSGNVQHYTPFHNSGTYVLDTVFDTAVSRVVAGAAIHLPRDVAVDASNNVYMLDSANNRILRASSGTLTASPWSVVAASSSWNNPYGMVVDSSGTIYLADTGNSRILKISSTTTQVIGGWGIGRLQFRFPRGIALDSVGRIYIADTDNHRIQVLAPDGSYLAQIGAAPLFGTIDKIALDAQNHLFAIDSDNNRVLAFLGGAAPFDIYLRDYVGDPGANVSDYLHHVLSSPDILVRHQPDVDLTAAASAGLESYMFQQPNYGQTNYVYVAIHNHGPQPAMSTTANLYYYDPHMAAVYPSDWKIDGFYQSYSDDQRNVPLASIPVPPVPANGVVVVGPLLWRPPVPESSSQQDGHFRVVVRLINPYDSAPTQPANTGQVRMSNNVAERPVIIQRGPFPGGPQNTLVLQLNFLDIGGNPSPVDVGVTVSSMAAWVKEVSYGQSTINFIQRGPLLLLHPSSNYLGAGNNPLVELAQEGLSRILTTEPTLLDGSGPGHEITRVILVTNQPGGTSDWATTGSWPYTFNGKTRYLTVSVQAADSPVELFEHGMAHQLGLEDLYAYPNVTFPRPYADGWDPMAKPIQGQHPLTWSKELAHWVSSFGAQILFVPRPAAGTTWNNNGQYVDLSYQETASTGQIVGIAVGLTNAVSNFSDETAFYYIEARNHFGSDQVLASTGVLVYYANTLTPQGQGPVILRDRAPGALLDDAYFRVGDIDAPGGTGLQVVVKTGTPKAAYHISLTYTPPSTDYDVGLQPGDPNWMSPDIWIDDQTDGYDEDNARAPMDRGNTGVAGEENRVYARVTNAGPATAYDVKVDFQLSQPWHTVGDISAFDDFKSIFVDQIASGQSVTPYVTWTPVTGVDPHTCALVQLQNLFNDDNIHNNSAQRNFEIDHSAHGSPYTPVDFPFQVRNSTTSAQLMYFRADGVPADWSWSLTPPKALVAAGAMQTGMLHLQPPITAPDCTSHDINVTGWIPNGDTLVQLGGSTVRVDMQRKTSVDLTLAQGSCNPPIKTGNQSLRSSLPPVLASATCAMLVSGGCTHPVQANQDIVLRYQNADGPPVYHTVHTDANGCYEDFNPVSNGGPWTVTVETPGNLCLAPATISATTTVPLVIAPKTDEGLPNGEHPYCLLSLTQSLQGTIVEPIGESPKASCPATISNGAVVTLQTSGDFAVGPGTLTLSGLQQLLVSAASPSGLEHAHFDWLAGTFHAVGQVTGTIGIGTHHKPLNGKENSDQPNHWELSLDGVVTAGLSAGSRLRATAAIDVNDPQAIGTVEAVLEHDGLLSAAQTKLRISKAAQDAKAIPFGTCAGKSPCLARVSKSGKGEFILDQTGTSLCADHKHTAKTWSRWSVNFTSNATVEGKKPALADGAAQSASWLQVTDVDATGRGEHAAHFVMKTRDGSTLVGTLLGVVRGGTHRAPLAENYESWNEPNHLEGRLVGTLKGGPHDGSTVEARYVIALNPASGRHQTFSMTLEGWVVSGCAASPTVVTPTLTPGIRRLSIVPKLITPKKPTVISRLPIAVKTIDPVTLQFQAIDTAHAGSLKEIQFITAVHSPESKAAPPPMPKKAPPLPGGLIPWDTLSVLDTDHDGKISSEEAKGLPALVAHVQFQRADLNHDGVIDLEEFRAYYKTMPAATISSSTETLVTPR